MNKIIFNELKKVTSVNLDFNEDTTKLYIPRTTVIIPKVGKTYKIALDESLLRPSSNSSFAANWNNGKVPMHREYIAEVSKIMTGYALINGVATNDFADNWFGWIPMNLMTVVCEM